MWSCFTHAPTYWQPYCEDGVSTSPLAGWPFHRRLCVCSVIRTRRPAFHPTAVLTDWCLPFSQIGSRLFSAFPGTGSVVLCGMIHKVLYLFGAKSVNGAQKRTDCVCHAPVKYRAEMLLLGSCIFPDPLNKSMRNQTENFFCQVYETGSLKKKKKKLLLATILKTNLASGNRIYLCVCDKVSLSQSMSCMILGKDRNTCFRAARTKRCTEYVAQ